MRFLIFPLLVEGWINTFPKFFCQTLFKIETLGGGL